MLALRSREEIPTRKYISNWSHSRVRMKCWNTMKSTFVICFLGRLNERQTLLVMVGTLLLYFFPFNGYIVQ